MITRIPSGGEHSAVRYVNCLNLLLLPNNVLNVQGHSGETSVLPELHYGRSTFQLELVCMSTRVSPESFKPSTLKTFWSSRGGILRKLSQLYEYVLVFRQKSHLFHTSMSLVKKSNYLVHNPTQNVSVVHDAAQLQNVARIQEFYRRPLPRHCISFSSPEGKRIFREALLSGHMETYFCLASQFCTQEEPSYCGLASLVMVLNALGLDPGRVWKSPWRWYHESMLTCCLPQDVLTKGITLDDFVKIGRCYGLDVDLHRVSSENSLSHFREMVTKMTSGLSEGYLVVCYSRSALGQTGTGHFAPVGGYHPQRELVFLFDTARFKYPPHWVSLTKLWESMNQVDPATQLPRGFVVLRKATIPVSSEQITEAQEELRFSFNSDNNTNCQNQLNNRYELQLFGISSCAYQAYSSRSTLLDSNSSSYKLKQLANRWIAWLKYEINASEVFMNETTHFWNEAIQFLFDEIYELRPTDFFYVTQPLKSSTETTTQVNHPPDNHQSVSFSSHSVLRDLVGSSLGRTVSDFISKMNHDFFTWLTTDGTFRLAISASNSWNTSADPCPFTVLTDPGLRLCLLMTSFLLVFPYNHFLPDHLLDNSVSSSSSCLPSSSPVSRLQIMIKLVDEVKLSTPTRNELNLLKCMLKSLMSKGCSLSCTSCVDK
uniref:glutathione gamma-glutamylcysteinyltransferase n=1 Tax=Trichobilharzia regenti TaxID=157069 RepID=A0AA85K2V3_TRIRE|nr:unnamed protein product [Trichobilharzia regenti]